MRTIRRLYFYMVSLISAEVALWGLVNLLRTTVDLLPGKGGANLLSSGLSLVLVGLPIALLHWSVAQREALRDEEERATRIRALFFYALRAALLVPVVQSLLAILSRWILIGLRLNPISALVGSGQTTLDNLIAIAVNLALFAYVQRCLKDDWQVNVPGNSLAEVRRLYRTLWILYLLGLTVLGTADLLRYLFFLPQGAANIMAAGMGNGLALVLVGTPLWVYTWLMVQRSLDDPAENFSLLRTVMLSILSILPAVAGLACSGFVFSQLVRWALGYPFTLAQFLGKTATPLAWSIPLLVLWIYFSGHLRRHWGVFSDELRRAALGRMYFYLLSLLGTAATFGGLWLLLSTLADLAFGKLLFQNETARVSIASAFGLLAPGLPLWVICWQRMQAAAAALHTAAGDHERRSVVRKGYLYIVLFAAVVGGMSAAGVLIYRLLNALFGNPPADFALGALRQALLVAEIALWLVYHLHVLRVDGRRAQRALAERQAAFPALILQAGEEEAEFCTDLVNALHRQAPGLPIAVQRVDQGIPDETLSAAKVVVLSAGLLARPPEALRLWLNGFTGQRVVVPLPAAGFTWLGALQRSRRELATEASAAVRALAEGQSVRPAAPTNAWAVTGYILAGLFSLELLVVVISLIANVMTR